MCESRGTYVLPLINVLLLI